jgi:SAM-dependent methyltransferase
MRVVVFDPAKDVIEMLRIVTDREVIAWEPDRPGKTLNVGAGSKMILGAGVLDLPGWDAERDPIPFGDESIANIYAIHFLEHISNPVDMLREFQRVLEPGGHLNIGLPYYTSQSAHSDLDHRSFWAEETWKHTFDNKYYQKHGFEWRFQIGTNLIMGVVERNLMLVTQLIKE